MTSEAALNQERDPRHLDLGLEEDRSWGCDVICNWDHPRTEPNSSVESGTDRPKQSLAFHEPVKPKEKNSRANEIAPHDDWFSPLTEQNAENEDDRSIQPLTFEQVRTREHIKFDQVRDIIPFWIKTVKAAERGEKTDSLGEFLASLDSIWGWDRPNSGTGWGYPYAYDAGEWGSGGRTAGDWEQATSAGGWKPDVRAEKRRGDESEWTKDKQKENVAKKPNKRDLEADTHVKGLCGDSFVEKVAAREAANAERRRNMHLFFRLPTQDKVKEIQNLIAKLRETRRDV